MNGQIERQRLAEIRNLKIRWLMLSGLAALCLLGKPGNHEWIAIGAMVLLGAICGFAVRSHSSYEIAGAWIASLVRGLDCLFWVGIALSPTFHADRLWLATIPLLIIEANTRRSALRLIAMAGLVVAAAVAMEATHAMSLKEAGVLAGAVAATGVISFLVVGMSAREDELQEHDRRFGAMIASTSALANSRDLHSMLDQILRLAVEEVGGDSGYVMLIDEDRPEQIRTEVAYGERGKFEMPERLEAGDGLSGYVVKTSQPIALRNRDRRPIECDGIQLGVRSAISVPLCSRVLIGTNECSHEQTLGALTVIGDPNGPSFGPDEMELLCSMGSLMAVAVSNARMEGRQRTTFLRTLESLATALEARDEYTRGHSQRVCEVSLMIAEHLGFGPDAIEELRIGTILHDIGKIGVPDQVLNKPGRLTDEEFAIMKQHPVIGYDICKPLMLADGVLMIIRNHHEKLDGSGYPDRLRGGELPLSLRIVCVADAFDAMSSRRPYRGVMPIEEVLGELSKGAGIQFDPVVVESLRELLPTNRMQDLYRSYWRPELREAA
ncbi:MAG TPA: HD domain-containing phosphohydrolase [Fimbriimonadaceae bacterium]|nr:HD domain-containing phosphohydrolase [Fimbriimonadaceae bacterium]